MKEPVHYAHGGERLYYSIWNGEKFVCGVAKKTGKAILGQEKDAKVFSFKSHAYQWLKESGLNTELYKVRGYLYSQRATSRCQ